MRGKAIFVAFFLLFTLASLAVPVPLFPGNMVHSWFNIPLTAYASFINAVTNGLVYGLVVWLVFVLITRKLEEPQLPLRRKRKNATKRNGK